MLQRCQNPKASHWSDYGGRGISVSAAWLDFGQFYRDMGDPPPGSSLDRMDVNGNYERGNCRWATTLVQVANRRNSLLVTVNGRRIALSALARETGVSYHTLYHRYRQGQL